MHYPYIKYNISKRREYAYFPYKTTETIRMNKNLSSTDMLVVQVLKSELTVPSITPTYRKEILNRIEILNKQVIPYTGNTIIFPHKVP